MNDVKVLVEICLRELTNILRNSGDARLDDLRLKYARKSEMIFKFCCFDRLFFSYCVSYLQVLHGILERTNWPLVADAFR